MGGRWADIGCGDGIFTGLLLEWLPPGSTVVAVDGDKGALRRLMNGLLPVQVAAVTTVQADFTKPLPLADTTPFDGLVLANSLHFVRDKLPVLRNLVTYLRPGGVAIIIEYNAARGNWAVPYPFRDTTCLDLMADAGLQSPVIINREPSSFLGEIYTARGVKRDA
jgi:SAM-dependent methyltransferase